jgi:hypothetical protein
LECALKPRDAKERYEWVMRGWEDLKDPKLKDTAKRISNLLEKQNRHVEAQELMVPFAGSSRSLRMSSQGN